MKPNLIDAIAVTWELCGGQKPSEPAMDAMVNRLDKFEPKQVIAALIRCQNELKGRISIGDIISRIDDGHLGADEAWALMPRSEDDSVVWTNQMMQAWDVSRQVSDTTAARMAFKEAYTREVAEARSNGRGPKWHLSMGFNKDGRESAALDGVVKGRLDPAWVCREFPQLVDRIPPNLLGGVEQPKQLPPQGDCPTPSEIKGLIGKLGEGMSRE